MESKAVFLFCAQAILVQTISSQCIGPAYSPYPIANDRLAWEAAGPWMGSPYPLNAPITMSTEIPLSVPYGPAALSASNGGGFLIKSASPIAVTGVSMTSENAYDGPLRVSGAIPFLAAVALEGVVPTSGVGAIAYSCGNGDVAMLSEDIAAGLQYADPYGPYGPGIGAAELGYGYGAPLAFEAGIPGPGYGYGYNRGCGGIY